MSNLKTSKVQQIQGNGTFTTEHGLFYNYEIKMENGDCGEYASKNYQGVDQLPFKVGEDIDYEWQPHEKFSKIKRPKLAGSKRWTPNQSGGNFRGGKSDEVQKLIVKQSCLERSIEVLTHNMPNTKIKSKTVIELATVFTDWVMDGYNSKDQPDGNWTGENKSPEPQNQPEPVSSESPLNQKYPNFENDDDLPF